WPARSTVSPRATGRTSRPAPSRCSTRRAAGTGASRPPSPPAAAGSFPPWTISSPSRRCCSTRGPSATSPSSPPPPWRPCPRLRSRPSVAPMPSDRLPGSQKAGWGLVGGYFDSHGWGFGVGVVTRREDPGEPLGQYGWDGGLGTTWRCDPGEQMVAILLTQRAWTSGLPGVHRDFLTLAYQAIDD